MAPSAVEDADVASAQHDITRANRYLFLLGLIQVLGGVAVAVVASTFFANEDTVDFVRVVVPLASVIIAGYAFFFDRKAQARADLHLAALRVDRAEALAQVREETHTRDAEFLKDVRQEGARFVRTLEEKNSGFMDDLSEGVAGLLHGRVDEVQQALTVMNNYFLARDRDPYGHRKTILDNALDELDDLARGLITLAGNEAYYEWLQARLASDKVSEVRAVSVRPLDLFRLLPDEQAFLQANISAAARGVIVRRVFVLDPDDLMREENRAVLEAVYRSAVACTTRWQSKVGDSMLTDMKKGGFSIYDGRALFLDETTIPQDFVTDVDRQGVEIGSGRRVAPDAHARVYLQPHGMVTKYKRLFDRLCSDAPPMEMDADEALVALYSEVRTLQAARGASVDELDACIARLRGPQ